MVAKKNKPQEPVKPWIRGRLNQSVDNKSKYHVSRSKQRARAKRNQRKTEIKEALIKPRTVVVLGLIILLLLWMPFTSYGCSTQKDDQACQELDTYNLLLDNATPALGLRFSPLINEEGIEADFLDSGLVSSVSVEKTWYNTLKINLVERSMFAIWRSNTGDSPKFALDRNGVAITEATNYTADELAEALDVRDEVALTPKPGDVLVETSVITAGLQLKAEDLINNYDLLYLQIDESSREFEAIYQHKQTDEKIRILFTTDRPLERQLIDANLAIDYLQEQGNNFKLIDVRLESSTAYR